MLFCIMQPAHYMNCRGMLQSRFNLHGCARIMLTGRYHLCSEYNVITKLAVQANALSIGKRGNSTTPGSITRKGITTKLGASNYEAGRSVNKLQNGAIPSVLKIGKIRNMRFVGNLILNNKYNFSR